MNLSLSVVICTYNRGELIAATINSILKNTLPPLEILVIDQSTSARTSRAVEAIAEKQPSVRLISTQTRGLSSARNIGLQESQGAFVAFTDDDCEADAGWLQALMECFEANPEIGLVGGALTVPKPLPLRFCTCPGILPEDALYDPAATNQTPPAGFGWVGGNFALRRSTFEAIGQFDPQIGAGTQFPAGEDTDYLLRLERAGVKMFATSQAIVQHTYGHRYGLKALLRHSENYARGNGALAAKLTLQGDPRGDEWLRSTQQSWIEICFRQKKLHRLLFAFRRIKCFTQAYRQCLREYQIDSETGLLQTRNTTPNRSAVQTHV